MSPVADHPKLPEPAAELLLRSWFAPGASGAMSAPLVALNDRQVPVVKARAGLADLLRLGYVEQRGVDEDGHPAFCGTTAGWRRREALLADRGRRCLALQQQREHHLDDLVIALLMTPSINNRRIKGGFFGSSEETPLEVLSSYLYQWSDEEIGGRLDFLESERLITRRVESARGARLVGLTVEGRLRYRDEVAERLAIAQGEHILDAPAVDPYIFFAWQSWTSGSRNQIAAALQRVIGHAASWGMQKPLRLEEAVVVGDGAVRIDAAILHKIRCATFFVADVSPYAQRDGVLIPNPNVLVEVGYALSSLKPVDIFLLVSGEAVRAIAPSGTGEQYPFDIQSVHRVKYEKPADLTRRLEAEVRARLAAKGLVPSGGLSRKA